MDCNNYQNRGNYKTDKELDQNVTKEAIDNYSNRRVIVACLNSKNVDRLFSITGCWIKAQITILQGEIHNDQELKQKAKIDMATGVDHTLFKIGQSYSKMIFGENLLVPTRNIAAKKTLRSEEDKIYYQQICSTISENLNNNLSNLIGYDQSYFSDDFKNSLNGETFVSRSANTEGICFSSVLYLIGKIFTEGDDEDSIIANAKNLEKGAPAEVAAKQEIYESIQFSSFNGEKPHNLNQQDVRENLKRYAIDIVLDKADLESRPIADEFKTILGEIVDEYFSGCIKHYSDEENGVHPEIPLSAIFTFFQDEEWVQKTVENMYAHDDKKLAQGLLITDQLQKIVKDFNVFALPIHSKRNAIAHLYNFKLDTVGTTIARKTLGSFTEFCSSKEHLKKFDSLSPGAYDISFHTEYGYHSIMYYKNKNGEGYLFDPNYGLIKCEVPHQHSMLKLLSMYPPPDKKESYEDDNRNYKIYIGKYNTRS